MRKSVILILLIFIADQLSKLFFQHWLSLGESASVFPGFSWVMAHNTGVAFSLFAHYAEWVRWALVGLTAIVVAVFTQWLRKTPLSDAWTRWGLCLIIGGALGNLWDRIYLGYVIDFIDIYYKSYHWPAFNIADSAICIGAVCLIMASASD